MNESDKLIELNPRGLNFVDGLDKVREYEDMCDSLGIVPEYHVKIDARSFKAIKYSYDNERR